MSVVEVSVTEPVPDSFEYFMNRFLVWHECTLRFTVNEMQAVLVPWSNPHGHYSHTAKVGHEQRNRCPCGS